MDKYTKLRQLVLDKNMVLNLTAITDEAEFDLKHIEDSLVMTSFFPLVDGMKVADLGTGAGFPGLPLAIKYPMVNFSLIDSVNKKLKFVDEASKELELNNVKVFHGRFEDLAHEKAHRESYDVVVSRAVASLPVLLEYMVGFAKLHGHLICYKSLRFEEELAESQRALKALNLELVSTNEYSLGEATHTIAIFKKTKATKEKYPRKAGTPKRDPL